jgi:hypothetical protein
MGGNYEELAQEGSPVVEVTKMFLTKGEDFCQLASHKLVSFSDL